MVAIELLKSGVLVGRERSAQTMLLKPKDPVRLVPAAFYGTRFPVPLALDGMISALLRPGNAHAALRHRVLGRSVGEQRRSQCQLLRCTP